MFVGWILFRTSSLARFRSSAAMMTTEVVPSPTSASWSSASSTRICEGTCGKRQRVRERTSGRGCDQLPVVFKPSSSIQGQVHSTPSIRCKRWYGCPNLRIMKEIKAKHIQSTSLPSRRQIIGCDRFAAQPLMPTLADGCSTSSSFRMVAPSFVTVTSPMSSTSICKSTHSRQFSRG